MNSSDESDYEMEVYLPEPEHLLDVARILRQFGMSNEVVDDSKLAPPTAKEIIDNLQVESVDDGQCPVCLKDFQSGDNGITLPCKHVFHPECIIPWLEKTSSCPLCRYQLPTDDERFEEAQRAKRREKERVKDIEKLHNSMYT